MRLFRREVGAMVICGCGSRPRARLLDYPATGNGGWRPYSMPKRWNTLASDSPGAQGFAGVVFAGHLLDGQRDNLLLHFARDRHHAVGVAHHHVLGTDEHAGAHHRDFDLHHAATTLRVQRSDTAVKDRKAHLHDLADVADQSVGDAPGGLAREAGGGEQFPPRRDAAAVAAGQDDDLVRLEVVDQLDLELIRIDVRLDMEHRHIEAGAGAPGHVDRQVERPDVRPHGLVAQLERVENVGQDRGGYTMAADAPDYFVRHGSLVSYFCLAMIWSLILS